MKGNKLTTLALITLLWWAFNPADRDTVASQQASATSIVVPDVATSQNR